MNMKQTTTEATHTDALKAEWLITYLDGEKNFVCSHCGYLALYDISEQAFDSHFCPHCGKRMINSTEPWTERCK